MGRRKSPQETRAALMEAATELMLEKGYTATSVDDICRAAGVTKGGFFHHFPGKQELAFELARGFNAMAVERFGPVLAQHSDPLSRVHAYLDIRRQIVADPRSLRCLLGTFVQELFQTHPEIREVCGECLDDHTEMLARDLEAARQRYAPRATWTGLSLARHLMAVLQGGMILAKASGDATVLVESLEHFRAYLNQLIKKEESTV